MEQMQPDKKRANGARIGTTLVDLKLKIAEHLINQADRYGPDEVYSIMAETKIRASKKTELMDKVRMVFSIS
jgi:hypothetical protein